MKLADRQLRSISCITIAAAAVYATFRVLPTGTNLSHMDFRVSGGNSIEFCDPANPQFLPVLNVRSPVSLTLRNATPLVANTDVSMVLTLKTASGRAIAPEDLLIAHTKLLHLMIVDPTLTDYQHVHPLPGRVPGEWTFTFRPTSAAGYRIFADFTPVATNRGLYATADIRIAPAQGSGTGESDESLAAVASRERHLKPPQTEVERDGYHFVLRAKDSLRARTPADLKFSIERVGGGAVPLEPVMGAFAHLVAFDEARSGFAHLHPAETDLSKPPDAMHPELSFKVTIPQAGSYVIWAQVNLGGRETFVPFWVDVAP